MSAKIRPASRKLLQYLERFGVSPKDHTLFSRALVHRSALNESRIHPESNERLEFLGDSVLGLLVAQYLFKRFPELSEGQMARRKAALVSEASLAEWAKTMRLGAQLVLGRGEVMTGGREKPAILADTFEAFLAALYLDQGLEKSRKFIDDLLNTAFKEVGAYSGQDAKSRLQELTQQKYKKPPRYRVSQTEGPDHAKTFEVEVLAEGEILATGNGRNKKEAEQRAAEKALLHFRKAE
jgi:ribonuclease-3